MLIDTESTAHEWISADDTESTAHEWISADDTESTAHEWISADDTESTVDQWIRADADAPKVPQSAIVLHDIAVKHAAPRSTMPADSDAAFSQWLAGSRISQHP